MSQKRLLQVTLALGVSSLLAACATYPAGPPYYGPPYDGPPPVVIIDPCRDFGPHCGPGHEPGRDHPPGPDRGHPDPTHGGRGPGDGPGRVKPPEPRHIPNPAPRPVHHDEEDQSKH